MLIPDDYPIPPQLRRDEIRFIKVDKGDNPDTPREQQFKRAVERDWPGDANYRWDDAELVSWIAFGGNYGVIPRGGISIIDIDDISAAERLGIFRDIGETFTVNTGSGHGAHIYILNEDLDGKFTFGAHDNDPKHLGDFYGSGCRAYVAGPGCRHHSGGTYQIRNDVPIARIGSERFKSAFLDRISYTPTRRADAGAVRSITNGSFATSSLSDQIGLRITDFAMPTNPKYIGGQFQGEHPLHGSSSGMNFTVNSDKNVWFCHRHHVGGDPVSWIAVLTGTTEDELRDNGGVTGLAFQRVVDYLWMNGYADRLRDLGYQSSIEPAPLADATPPAPLSLAPPMPTLRLEDLVVDANPTLEIDLPKEHFISRFIAWCDGRTDAFHEYKFAAAITLLSIVVQRCAVIRLAQEHVYPNIFTFWIGRSSVSHKTTVIRLTNRFIDANYDIAEPRLDNDFTPESLIEAMSETPRSFLIKDEAAGLLAKMQKPYMAGTRDLMCSLYDGQTIAKRLTRKAKQESRFIVKDPYMTELMATTPDGFEKESDSENIYSGWFYRFLWVWPNREKTTEMKLTMEDPCDIPEQDALTTWLHDLHVFFGSRISADGHDTPVSFSMTEAQFSRFSTWTSTNEAAYAAVNDDVKLSAFARLQIYALKLAMLFMIGDEGALSRMDRATGNIQISDRYLDLAIRMIEDHYIPVAVAIFDLIDLAESGNDQKRILKALRQYGGKIERRDLMRKTRMRKKDFDDAMSQLLNETHEVAEDRVQTATGKSTLAYRLINFRA